MNLGDSVFDNSSTVHAKHTVSAESLKGSKQMSIIKLKEEFTSLCVFYKKLKRIPSIILFISGQEP